MREAYSKATVQTKLAVPTVGIFAPTEFAAPKGQRTTPADKLLIRAWMTAATAPRLQLKKKEPGKDDSHDITGDHLADLLPDLTPEELKKLAERINNSPKPSATDVAEGILDDPDGYTE